MSTPKPVTPTEQLAHFQHRGNEYLTALHTVCKLLASSDNPAVLGYASAAADLLNEATQRVHARGPIQGTKVKEAS